MIKFIILTIYISIAVCKVSVNYFTWSLENGTNFDVFEDAIALWKIKPLEFARVKRGGDVKIYFVHFDANDSRLGFAHQHFKGGLIFLRENMTSEDVFYVLQHEWGHVLGVDHENDTSSIMYPFFNVNNVSDVERQKAFEKHECRFDSVALINYQTYLVFTGSHYKRLDIYTNETTQDQVWHPFIIIVDAMYRKNNGNYILISNKEFFEFNSYMKFVRQGFLESLFPYVPYVDSVLKLRNGTTIVFSNYDAYKDGRKIALDVLKTFSGSIRGAFELLDGSIQMIDKYSVYTFDRNFNYISRSFLCETEYFSFIHCCVLTFWNS